MAEALTSPQALEDLCRKYMPRIHNYVLKRVGNVEESEDLTSTVFEKMIEGLEGYDAERASFATWLYRIALNAINDHYRKRGSRTEQDLEPLADNLHYSEESDVPRLERYLVLVDLLEGLPQRTQEVLTLRFFEDMSLEEISEIVDISQKAVSKRVIRGLKELYRQVGATKLDYLC